LEVVSRPLPDEVFKQARMGVGSMGIDRETYGLPRVPFGKREAAALQRVFVWNFWGQIRANVLCRFLRG